MLLPHATFQELLNQDNQVMLLLHAHWIALSQIMAFINDQEYEMRAKKPGGPSEEQQAAEAQNPGLHRWLRYINARVDYEHQMYNQWPMWVDESIEKDPTFFGKRIMALG